MAAAKKDSGAKVKPAGPAVGAAPAGMSNPAAEPWDPGATSSTSPGGPSLADEEQRQFHATHFTADPRGAAMSGSPPGGRRRKARGGTPPDADGHAPKSPRPKRRGGAGPG